MGTSLKVSESGRGFKSFVWTFLWEKQVQVPSSRGKFTMGVSYIPHGYFIGLGMGRSEENIALLLSPVFQWTEIINSSCASDQVQTLGLQP